MLLVFALIPLTVSVVVAPMRNGLTCFLRLGKADSGLNCSQISANEQLRL